jgi:hypothetical protein
MFVLFGLSFYQVVPQSAAASSQQAQPQLQQQLPSSMLGGSRRLSQWATLSASQGISAVFHHTSSSLGGSTLALKDFGGLCVACPPPSSSAPPAPVSSDASPLASPAELSRLWAALLTTCAAAQEERIGGSSASHPLYTLVLAVGGTLGVSCLPPLPPCTPPLPLHALLELSKCMASLGSSSAEAGSAPAPLPPFPCMLHPTLISRLCAKVSECLQASQARQGLGMLQAPADLHLLRLVDATLPLLPLCLNEWRHAAGSLGEGGEGGEGVPMLDAQQLEASHAARAAGARGERGGGAGAGRGCGQGQQGGGCWQQQQQ